MRRSFGSLRALPSGRIQARHKCPTCQALHPAHVTFDSKERADTWLSKVRADIEREVYVCPIQRERTQAAEQAARRTLAEYGEHWLRVRRKSNGQPLTQRTRREYAKQLAELIETFGPMPLEAITPSVVRTWWRLTLPEAHPDRLTGNAHVYALLRTILGTAVEDELIPSNPCTIPGAGVTKRRRAIKPATPAELELIAGHDRMPDRYRMAVTVAGWCTLRFGEVAELRRRDIAPDGSVLTVARGMTYADGMFWVGKPKADSGGDVAVPPHLRERLLQHLETHAQPGLDGLLFWRTTGYTGRCGCGYAPCKGGHIYSQHFDRYYRPARAGAGRADLRFHDLRHTGQTFAAEAGASVADLMKRARHSTMAASLIYMHAVDGKDAQLARRMSELLAPVPAPG